MLGPVAFSVAIVLLQAPADPPPPAAPAAPPAVEEYPSPGLDNDDDNAPPRRDTGDNDGSDGGELQSLGFLDRYMPWWFPDDLHPQLEDFKWTYILGGVFVPSSTFWSPYFMVKPAPDVDVRELLKTALFRWGIQVGGTLAIFGAWILLGVTCPPGLGFYLWYMPMVLAYGAWMLFGTWQTQLSMLVTWNAMLHDQGIPDEPKAKGRRKRVR
ncbi:MAG: hypothetical protein HY904_02510 [Deltaproteobacteria bacterium]|nr:hypothetical protein [Deltaproteobacteria bacterium]